MTILPKQPNWWFEDIIIGRTYDFGAALVSEEDIKIFHDLFAPNLPLKPSDDGLEHRGPRAAESHIYALWRQMLFDETRTWPIQRRLTQENLRFYRSCYAGDELFVRLTFMSVEERGEDGGILTAGHEILDKDELLVMSVLTRTLMRKRPK